MKYIRHEELKDVLLSEMSVVNVETDANNLLPPSKQQKAALSALDILLGLEEKRDLISTKK